MRLQFNENNQPFYFSLILFVVFVPGQPPPREVKLVNIEQIWLTLRMVLVLHTNAKHLVHSAAQKARPFRFQAYSEERLDCTECYSWNKWIKQNHGQVFLQAHNAMVILTFCYGLQGSLQFKLWTEVKSFSLIKSLLYIEKLHAIPISSPSKKLFCRCMF